METQIDKKVEIEKIVDNSRTLETKLIGFPMSVADQDLEYFYPKPLQY